jgi:hypothetical protein
VNILALSDIQRLLEHLQSPDLTQQLLAESDAHARLAIIRAHIDSEPSVMEVALTLLDRQDLAILIPAVSDPELLHACLSLQIALQMHKRAPAAVLPPAMAELAIRNAVSVGRRRLVV